MLMWSAESRRLAPLVLRRFKVVVATWVPRSNHTMCVWPTEPWRPPLRMGPDEFSDVIAQWLVASAPRSPRALRPQQTAEPARKRRGVVELLQAEVGVHKGILCCVLRIVNVAQLRASVSEGHILEAQDDLTEGLVFPAFYRFYNVSY